MRTTLAGCHLLHARALILLLCGLAPALRAAPALGQVAQAAEERVRLLNKEAMTHYEGLEFEKAKKSLEQALATAKKHNVERGKAASTTHLNLGIVWGAGFNNREMAVQHFTKALCIDRTKQLDPMLATPDMEELFTNAKQNAKTHCPKKVDTKFEHKPLEAAKEGKPVRVWAKLGAGLKFHQLILAFRATGEPGFSRVAMRRTKPGVYLGIIDSHRVKPRAVHYYLEAQDQAGDRIKGHGSAGSPNIIRVIPKPPDKNGKPTPTPTDEKTISIGVMVGTGGGIVHGGKTETLGASIESDDQGNSGPGLALAPFHISPEINYHINRNWQIGVLGRIQVVNSVTKEKGMASNVSVAGVLRAKRLFRWDPIKVFLGFGAGGGQIRHRIHIPNDEVWDARVAQYILFNLGGGVQYMFTDMVGAVFEIDMLVAVPDFTAHADFNLGVVLSF